MGLQGKQTRAWFERARSVLVNGVSSQFRYWGDEDTMVIARGDGAYVYDMDGNRYIDYQLGFGPVILGHGHPGVAEAVAQAAAEGTTFAMTQQREVEAAEKFKQAVPWVEYLRFTNTGTEATMHAVRLARGYTGRDVILKFEGQYHGVHDYVMFSTAGAPPTALGSRYRPVPWQSSSGIPDGIRSYVQVLPFNDLDLAERLFRRAGHQIAAVLVEPMLGTFAKAMGNGFPVGAIAGRGEVIRAWAKGGIAQAGTYSGNGVAVAAASATIDELSTGEPYRNIEKTSAELRDGLARICTERGVPAHIVGHPAMFSISFSEQAPQDFRDTAGHDAELYLKVVLGLIRRGVMPVDDALEPWFLCAVLSDEDVAETLTAFDESLSEATG